MLFILADRRADCPPLRLEYCESALVEELAESFKKSLPQLQVPPNLCFTRLGGVVPPDQMKTDYTFTLTPRKSFRLTLYTRIAAVQLAGNIALILWSLGMAIALVVLSYKSRRRMVHTGMECYDFVRRPPDPVRRHRLCVRYCFRIFLALSAGALWFYHHNEASMEKLRPGETVTGYVRPYESLLGKFLFPGKRPQAKVNSAKINLRLSFRDKATGQPVNNAQGILSDDNWLEYEHPVDLQAYYNRENWNWHVMSMKFFKANRAGKANVKNFILKEDHARRENYWKGRWHWNPTDKIINEYWHDQDLHLAMEAPGYARELF